MKSDRPRRMTLQQSQRRMEKQRLNQLKIQRQRQQILKFIKPDVKYKVETFGTDGNKTEKYNQRQYQSMSQEQQKKINNYKRYYDDQDVTTKNMNMLNDTLGNLKKTSDQLLNSYKGIKANPYSNTISGIVQNGSVLFKGIKQQMQHSNSNVFQAFKNINNRPYIIKLQNKQPIPIIQPPAWWQNQKQLIYTKQLNFK